MKETIYLDHAATTPMAPAVIEVMTNALRENYGNASSIHHLGKKNRILVDQARTTMAQSIGANAREIVITSGGTESDNMALIKTAEYLEGQGRHIISTAIEHPAVLNPLAYLETKGYEVTYLPVNEKGQISVEQVKAAIRPDTTLVSVMYGNNEVGSIQPIQAIGEMLAELEQEIVFHTDAVQAYGTISLDVSELKVDLLSVSAHKMNGPKGIGFLYIREGLNIPSLLMGGAQENERRAGTENIPAILGFEKAIQLHQADKEGHYHYLLNLKNIFVQLLKEQDIPHTINGTLTEALPHVLSVNFPTVRSDMMLIHMDLNAIALSAGSACSAGTVEPSHVLLAMFGENASEIAHTIRFSFGLGNTVAELEKVVSLLKMYTAK